jgi:hypothetical protein
MTKVDKAVRLNRHATLQQRLARIEYHMRPPPPERLDMESIAEEELLAQLRIYASHGYFRHETDFPQALEELEAAYARARQNPQFMPPPEFMPTENDIRRRRYWRDGKTPVELHDAVQWVIGMLVRVNEGIPAVTLKEWEAMRHWYQAHRSELPNHWTVEIKDKKYNLQAVDGFVKNNEPKVYQAGVQLMVLRELYSRYHLLLKGPSLEPPVDTNCDYNDINCD